MRLLLCRILQERLSPGHSLRIIARWNRSMSAMPRKRRLAVKASSVAMGQELPPAPQKNSVAFIGWSPGVCCSFPSVAGVAAHV
jgi:hypothetical protein